MTEKISAKSGVIPSGEFITHSDEETFDLGVSIGRQISRREIFLLHGELGAGKTVFAKGVACGLDIDPADVTSPSFTLVNIHEGRLRFYHIDLYRLEAGEHRDLGLDEIIEEEAVTVIEWAERLRSRPLDAIHIDIEYVSDLERRIRIRAGS